MLSVAEIKELIEWVARHKVRGVEVERSGFRLRIEGTNPPEQIQTIVAAPAHVAAAAPVVAIAAPAPHPQQVSELPHLAATSEDVEEGLHLIKSPIVGTFYRSAGPDKEPFVKPGDRVAKGQTLCILEAMKLMNEIESDAAGEIVKVYVQNGQPVEYGERLFAIRAE